MADVLRVARPRPETTSSRRSDPEYDYYCAGVPARRRSSAARDHQTFSSAQGLTVNYGELEMIGLHDTPPMVQDPPVHTDFALSRLQCATTGRNRRAHCAFVVERSKVRAPTVAATLSPNYLTRFPSMVVAHYLGVPEED